MAKKITDKFTRIPGDAHRLAIAESVRVRVPMRSILRAAIKHFMTLDVYLRERLAVDGVRKGGE